MEPGLQPNAAFVGVLLVVALASAVKGALGFGLPLIAVPVAANLIGARTAVTLIAITVVFSNAVILFRGGSTAEQARQFAGLLGGVVVGTVIGAGFLGRLDPGRLAIVVGVTALVFALLGLLDRTPAVPAGVQRYAGPAVGLASGLLGGTTGIFAPVIAPYIHALRLGKREFVFWLTAAFFVGGVTQVLSYYRLGLYSGPLVLYGVLTFIPVVVGTRLGTWIQDRLPADLFRRLVLVLVMASGLNLILGELV